MDDEKVDEARVRHREVASLENELSAAREVRDTAIREAVDSGATKYRVAKEIGLTEMQVGRITKAGK